MTVDTLEKRVAALEVEVARLKLAHGNESQAKKPWWEEIRGTFKDDPMYEEAMRLGREWRNAQRPEYEDEPET